MNILFVTNLYPTRPADTPADVSLALHELVREWRRAGHDVLVLRPRHWRHGIRYDVTEVDGVRVVTYPHLKMPLSSRVVTSNAHRYVAGEGFEPDIVVGHLWMSMQTALAVARRYGRSCVLGVHRSDIDRWSLVGPALVRADAVAMRSPSVSRRALALSPGLADKSFIAPSGISPDVVQPPEVVARKAEALASGGPIHFVTIARLLPLKNIDVTIEALSRLTPELDWRLRIVGSGETETQLRELVAARGVDERVTFDGALPHERALETLHDASVFVMVSAPETLGLVYLEAMAHGVIAIGATGEGIDGIVVDGDNGFLVPPRDVDALVSCIRRVVSLDRTAAETTIARALETAADYTTDRLATRYLEHLAAVAGRSATMA